jgi:hypothetical protein
MDDAVHDTDVRLSKQDRRCSTGGPDAWRSAASSTMPAGFGPQPMGFPLELVYVRGVPEP